jgi:hypothetical protein
VRQPLEHETTAPGPELELDWAALRFDQAARVDTFPFGQTRSVGVGPHAQGRGRRGVGGRKHGEGDL